VPLDVVERECWASRRSSCGRANPSTRPSLRFRVPAVFLEETVREHIGAETEVLLRSEAHVDNVYALFSSPNRKLLDAAKSAFR
jgi:hypothetical protein